MEELFPISLNLPSGFVYKEGFINHEEEQQLVRFMNTVQLRPLMFQGFEAKRKVASFGYDYNFEHKELSKGEAIPNEIKWLIAKVSTELSIPEENFVEVLFTEYPVGSVINWHRDAPPFDIIVGISLLSDCIFKLRPHDKTKQSRKATVSLDVRRRSMYVISGESRSQWQHSTAPVKQIRFSITLRTLKSKMG